MAKSIEAREKEWQNGQGLFSVFGVWESKTSKVRKEIDAATYNGIAALAKRYDAAMGKFIRSVNGKDRSTDVFGQLWQDLQVADEQLNALYVAIGTLNEASFATVQPKSGDRLEDQFVDWEEMLKRARDVTKQFKVYFDQFNRLNEAYDKRIADVLTKARAQAAALKAELSSSNNELNALEQQIRSAVIAAEGAAVKQNKLEVAKAVKEVLKVFGK